MITDGIFEKLIKEHNLEKHEIIRLLEAEDSVFDSLKSEARFLRDKIYGKKVFVRGLIEISSFCSRDCLYCGLRCSNRLAERYRLLTDDILECCISGYKLGFRTFVLQGGEDNFYKDEYLCEIIRKIKADFSDCAVTLSLGEKSIESLEKLRNAGVDRYLLREETADKIHYEKLHPVNMSFENRIQCIENIKNLGFQTGCGFMVGSPFQTLENLAEDLLYIKKSTPAMIGIGPFIPHNDTPFAGYPAGSVKMTLRLICLLRLMNPYALIPSTTALSTLCENGKIMGLDAGANVVMLNLSPASVRNKYMIYNNKKYSGDEAAESLQIFKDSLKETGLTVEISRGDYIREGDIKNV